MKKNYSILALGALLTFGSVSKLSAQAMSGTVTINSAQATGGTNYQTFTAFAAAINTAGVNGPLVVNVVANSGPYNEQPALTNIAGTSAANKITINGNGNTLTFNSSSSATPYTLLLNNVDFMTITNLKVEAVGATYGMALVLTNGSDNNTFSACTFSCPSNGTGSYHIPVTFNSSTSLPTTGGNPGNFNTFTTCTLTGGYYSIWHYGLTAAPYTRNNSFLYCAIQDFYVYMWYGYYSRNVTIKGCDISRPTRTNLTTTYLWTTGDYTHGLLFDSNVIHDLFQANTGFSGTLYGFMYLGYGGTDGLRNKITNNIFRDIKWNGSTYLFYYNYNAINDYWHNTFSFDNTTSTSHNGYIFYYCYGSGNNFNTWRNNLFSITQAGTGSWYCFYFGGSTTGSQINNNNYWLTATNAWPGYWTAQANTFSAWQSQGPDANGTNINPQFINLAGADLHPANTALNNLGTPLGIFFDQSGAVRNQTTPDVGALEFLTPNCTGTPTNSIAGPNYSLCPGETANFNVNNLSSDNGITYQWQVSTVSNVGPFTAIAGATTFSLTAPNQTAQAWYSAVINCTAAGGGSIAPVWQVNIAGTTTSSVPYNEGFEGIGLNNRLPNCSWLAPSIGNAALTYTSSQTLNRIARNGAAFASFANSQTSPNAYYTNGIQLNAGVTYSASVWYQTDLTGATNWSDLRLMVGSTQTTSSMQTIVSTNGAAVSAVYKLLSGTFTVSTSGIYYVAIRATAGSGTAQYLSIDDLKIDIPCSEVANVPNITVSAANATICTGASAVLTANGANTYVWAPGGATTAINNDQPSSTTIYTVTGTNTLTGCSNKNTIKVNVKQSPSLNAVAIPALVCEGKSAILSASGASSYTWAAGGTGAIKTVTVTGAANYSVIGTGTNGCTSSAVVAVNSIPNPTVTATSSQMIFCTHETVTLTANGASSYQWVCTNPANVLSGGSLNFNTALAGAYSYVVTGTDAQGCQGTANLNLTVDACTGLNESANNTGVRIFPNPTTGKINVVSSASSAIVEVMDMTGRVVFTQDVKANSVVDLSGFASGVYYVRVNAENFITVTKVIKN
jgi:hypothetical protein